MGRKTRSCEILTARVPVADFSFPDPPSQDSALEIFRSPGEVTMKLFVYVLVLRVPGFSFWPISEGESGSPAAR
jgi:hypothetical protein